MAVHLEWLERLPRSCDESRQAMLTEMSTMGRVMNRSSQWEFTEGTRSHTIPRRMNKVCNVYRLPRPRKEECITRGILPGVKCPRCATKLDHLRVDPEEVMEDIDHKMLVECDDGSVIIDDHPL